MLFSNKLFRLTFLTKQILLGLQFLNENVCFTRKEEAAGFEDWFIDRKPDELKFIGVTYIARPKAKKRELSSENGGIGSWAGIEKETFSTQ